MTARPASPAPVPLSVLGTPKHGARSTTLLALSPGPPQASAPRVGAWSLSCSPTWAHRLPTRRARCEAHAGEQGSDSLALVRPAGEKGRPAGARGGRRDELVALASCACDDSMGKLPGTLNASRSPSRWLGSLGNSVVLSCCFLITKIGATTVPVQILGA